MHLSLSIFWLWAGYDQLLQAPVALMSQHDKPGTVSQRNKQTSFPTLCCSHLNLLSQELKQRSKYPDLRDNVKNCCKLVLWFHVVILDKSSQISELYVLEDQENSVKLCMQRTSWCSLRIQLTLGRIISVWRFYHAPIRMSKISCNHRAGRVSKPSRWSCSHRTDKHKGTFTWTNLSWLLRTKWGWIWK